MKAVKYAIGLVLGLAATAAMVTATASAAPHPAPALSSVSLTNADNGRAVAVRVGDEVRVRLTGGRGQGVTWVSSEPVTSEPANLRLSGGAASPSGDAAAVFRAVERGKSEITSARRCVADPGHLCPHAVLQWKTTVDVR
ncbi:hypothetical protein [Streptomyces sp. NPDC020362]|uniref:hypothetical protein n=1 Tax=unclassified Streptomyces TaxID=2593676 RepID=UPI0033CB92B6